jgi:hypothetical protein
MLEDKMKTHISTIALALIMPIASFAQESPSAPIDVQLDGQLDFRALAFEGCMGVNTCSAQGVTISGERRDQTTGEWTSTALYWDPIDGIGVQNGGQNDEIDFDERVVVKMDRPARIADIWLSDLFIAEAAHYGASFVGATDAESADIELRSDGATLTQARITGDLRLPNSSFNEAVSGAFIEDGDLMRRVVIDDEIISVVVPGLGRNGREVLLRAPIGQIDKDKKLIFAGLETIEVDITDLLARVAGTPIYGAFETNELQVSAVLGATPQLTEMRTQAAIGRSVSSHANGEVSGSFGTTALVDEVIFVAPIDTSNDYSVAGFVLAN